MPTRGHGPSNRRCESDQRGQELHELSNLSPSPVTGHVSALVHLKVKSGTILEVFPNGGRVDDTMGYTVARRQPTFGSLGSAVVTV